MEVSVSISDCQVLISRVPIKKIFVSFGLSARDVLNNLFRFENKIFVIYQRWQANVHLNVFKLCEIYISSIPTDLD